MMRTGGHSLPEAIMAENNQLPLARFNVLDHTRAPAGPPCVRHPVPLGRFSVLDLTRARAGPTCVRQLVDWGATAIKIEMPGGRTGDGMGGNRHGFDFQNLHRNKKGITLNLRDPEGVAIFKKLAV